VFARLLFDTFWRFICAVGYTSYGSYPRTKIAEMGKTNLRKANTNTQIYVKNPKGKNHTHRDSTIIMVITMVILWCARVFGLNDHPLLEGISYLYK